MLHTVVMMRPNPFAHKTLEDPTFGPLVCTEAYHVHPVWKERLELDVLPEAPMGLVWESTSAFAYHQFEVKLSVTSADWEDVLRGTRAEGEFTDAQRAAYEAFLDQQDVVRPQLSQALLDYYRLCIEVTDYGTDLFQPVDSVEALFGWMYNLVIRVPWQEASPAVIGLTCDCEWEDEHGFGVLFEDGRMTTWGASDIVY